MSVLAQKVTITLCSRIKLNVSFSALVRTKRTRTQPTLPTARKLFVSSLLLLTTWMTEKTKLPATSDCDAFFWTLVCQITRKRKTKYKSSGTSCNWLWRIEKQNKWTRLSVNFFHRFFFNVYGRVGGYSVPLLKKYIRHCFYNEGIWTHVSYIFHTQKRGCAHAWHAQCCAATKN